MNTAPGLELAIVWLDEHMLEFRLSASNDVFAGKTQFYAALDESTTFAARIKGFPTALDDVREYEFGGTGLPGYGARSFDSPARMVLAILLCGLMFRRIWGQRLAWSQPRFISTPYRRRSILL